MHRALPHLWIVSLGQIPRSGMTKSQDMDILWLVMRVAELLSKRATPLQFVRL